MKAAAFFHFFLILGPVGLLLGTLLLTWVDFFSLPHFGGNLQSVWISYVLPMVLGMVLPPACILGFNHSQPYSKRLRLSFEVIMPCFLLASVLLCAALFYVSLHKEFISAVFLSIGLFRLPALLCCLFLYISFELCLFLLPLKNASPENTAQMMTQEPGAETDYAALLLSLQKNLKKFYRVATCAWFLSLIGFLAPFLGYPAPLYMFSMLYVPYLFAQWAVVYLIVLRGWKLLRPAYALLSLSLPFLTFLPEELPLWILLICAVLALQTHALSLLYKNPLKKLWV